MMKSEQEIKYNDAIRVTIEFPDDGSKKWFYVQRNGNATEAQLGSMLAALIAEGPMLQDA